MKSHNSILFYPIKISNISGWWFFRHPSEKWWSEFVSWDDFPFPIWWESHNPFMFQSPPIRTATSSWLWVKSLGTPTGLLGPCAFGPEGPDLWMMKHRQSNKKTLNIPGFDPFSFSISVMFMIVDVTNHNVLSVLRNFPHVSHGFSLVFPTFFLGFPRVFAVPCAMVPKPRAAWRSCRPRRLPGSRGRSRWRPPSGSPLRRGWHLRGGQGSVGWVDHTVGYCC